MGTMNGSGESARKSSESIGKSTQQTTEPQESKGIGYDSPLEVLVAAIDAVSAHIKEVVSDAHSQRLAAFALWLLQRAERGVQAYTDEPDRAPNQRQLEKRERGNCSPLCVGLTRAGGIERGVVA